MKKKLLVGGVLVVGVAAKCAGRKLKDLFKKDDD